MELWDATISFFSVKEGPVYPMLKEVLNYLNIPYHGLITLSESQTDVPLGLAGAVNFVGDM